MDFFFRVKGIAWLERITAGEGFIHVLLPLSVKRRSSDWNIFSVLITPERKHPASNVWEHTSLTCGDGDAVMSYAARMMSYLLVKAAQISVLPHAAQDLRCCFHHLGRMSGGKEENRWEESHSHCLSKIPPFPKPEESSVLPSFLPSCLFFLPTFLLLSFLQS